MTRIALAMILVLLTSCSNKPRAGDVRTATPPKAQILSVSDAAQLAAKLANEECERRFQRRPFNADQYVAVLKDGEYRWGRLDEGAPGGYSAAVTFKEDGSKPAIKVYLSTDLR
jgi:hypothetical protein